MHEITREEILAAAEELRKGDEIEVHKLPRHDILNLKAILERLADSKPLQQEIEEIKEDYINAWLQIRTIQSRLDDLEIRRVHQSSNFADIYSRLAALESMDILEHLARGKMLEEKVIDLKREVSVLTQPIHIKLLEMWSRISDIQTFVGMPKESE